VKDFNRALNYSFLLLRYRARSRVEIDSRLKRKKYSLSVREQVLNYLEENNYLNDKEFAYSFANYSFEKGWGPRRIDYKLKELGIPPKLRKQALAEDFAYDDKIREIIQRKLKHYKSSKPALPAGKVWQKIAMHLERKGFDYKSISQEIENLGVNPVREWGFSNGVKRFEGK